MNQPMLFDLGTCPSCGSDRLAILDGDNAATCSECGDSLVRFTPSEAWERFADAFGRPPSRPKATTRQGAR